MRLRRLVDALQRSLFDAERDDGRAVEAHGAAVALQHPRATRSALLEGHAVGYLLRRSRRRTIGFSVGSDGLTVTAPGWVALRDIDAAVRERGRWIVAKLAEQRERADRAGAARVAWVDGATIRFLGAPLRIALDPARGIAEGEVRLDPHAAPAGDGEPAAAVRTLRVGLPRDAGEERVRDAVQSWLQREARRVFAERAAHFAERLGVRMTRLSLSSAETRWGSASSSGAIRLNWRLIHSAPATIDYVVAHELAHLREMNHSARFWDVVRSVVPNVEEERKRLREGEVL